MVLCYDTLPPPNQETDTLSITLVPRQDKIHPLFHDILGLGGSLWFPLMVFLVPIPLLSWYFPRYPCVRVGIIVQPAVCVWTHARVCVCVCAHAHALKCSVSLTLCDPIGCTSQDLLSLDFPGENTGVSCHFLL